MNRSPLNQTPLGSGTSNNLARVAITQVLELVSTLRSTVVKYVSITQEHTLEQSLRTTYWVSEKLESITEHLVSLTARVETGIANTLSGLCTLLGSLGYSVWTAATESPSNELNLIGSCNGTKETNSAVESSCIQESLFTYRVELQIPFSLSLEHQSMGQVTGYDLNTSQAPEERQIICPADNRNLVASA